MYYSRCHMSHAHAYMRYNAIVLHKSRIHQRIDLKRKSIYCGCVPEIDIVNTLQNSGICSELCNYFENMSFLVSIRLTVIKKFFFFHLSHFDFLSDRNRFTWHRVVASRQSPLCVPISVASN